MHADEALLVAWRVDDNAEGWTQEALERVEWVLPALVAAGYAQTAEVGSPPTHVWSFTESGVDRWCELRRCQRRHCFRRIRRLKKYSDAEGAAAEFVAVSAAVSLSIAKELHDRARPEAEDWRMRVPRRWRRWPPSP